ncbi:maleylpyruvate isomerase N-terminal domain-containing protein [Streptomyces sp. NPDC057686]|uniref:maleylpyruvate isomerase N-terminal domain-containing protein n=1 Tax=Streptomyces sp. NPDC057686 TaxID=3346212 RepID=UPI0036879336
MGGAHGRAGTPTFSVVIAIWTEPAQEYARHRLLGSTERAEDAAPALAQAAWNAPSPCAQWTTLHVRGHLVDGRHQVAALITGQGPREPLKDPVAAVGGAPASAWAATTRHLDGLLGAVDPAAVVPSHHGAAASLTSAATSRPPGASYGLSVSPRGG